MAATPVKAQGFTTSYRVSDDRNQTVRWRVLLKDHASNLAVSIILLFLKYSAGGKQGTQSLAPSNVALSILVVPPPYGQSVFEQQMVW